jgi:hypothetical protein
MSWKFSGGSLYSTNGKPETSKRTKVNTTGQKMADNQQYDAMAR